MKILTYMLLSLTTPIVMAFEFPKADNLWLREAPPTARMLAAYATIENNTSEDLRLVGAYAPDFGMAEIHKTIEVNGLLKMREQKELALPAESTIVMQPGGLHIMLMMPKAKFKAGDEARICLIYQDTKGKEHVQHLDFPVKKQ
ncbi:MAG: copper chaperone PCu(A)C [Marinicella sp.]